MVTRFFAPEVQETTTWTVMAQVKLKPRAVANRRGARRALCPPPLGQARALRQDAARSMSCQLA